MNIRPLKQDQKSTLESPRPIFLITGCIIELAPGEHLPEFPEGKGGFVAMAMSGCLVRPEQPQPAIESELEEMRRRAERAETFEGRERALRQEIQAERNSLEERIHTLCALNTELRSALDKYGKHLDYCSQSFCVTCSCGLDRLRSQS